MRRIWERYRGLRTRWQVLIGVAAVGAVLSPFSGESADEARTAVATSAPGDVGDIADELPFAPTTTTSPPPPTTAPPQAFVAAPPPASPPAASSSGAGCHPSYEPCVPIASDVDCTGGSGNGPAYTGRVSVIGWDEYDLDRDADGVGCE